MLVYFKNMRVNYLITARNISHSHSIRNMANSRIFAISDLHVDYKENLQFVNAFSGTKYKEDVLIVAGDVTDSLILLESTLKSFTKKFKQVCYVPGNHELWIKSKQQQEDSITKFWKILEICDKINIHYKPVAVQTTTAPVWIVPLFSWYAKPEDDPGDSLYRKPPAHVKENVEFGESVWMDNHLCKWTKLPHGQTASMYFSALNRDNIHKYDAPVISFSHFLPRWELIPGIEAEMNEVIKERDRLGLGEAPKAQGGVKGFNFARYAGSKILGSQIKKINSVVHVYGHQHRNRDRIIDDVRYVSHCLGNPREQKEGWVWGIHDWQGPKQIWPVVEYSDDVI